MKRIPSWCLAAAVSVSGAAQAQFYNLTGTGVQGIYGLSFDGTRAIGASAPSPTAGVYYRWELGVGATSIGGRFNSGQPRLSNDGGTAVINATNPATGLREMSRYDWAAGTTTFLGSLGGSSDGEASSGWGVSGNGQVAVGLGWLAGGGANGIVVNGGTVSSVGTTVPGRSTRANAADFDGSVIVGWQDSSTGFRQGALWNNGVQILMADSAGNPMSELSDVSADGSWAAGLGPASNGFTAYRWSQATGVQSLGPNLAPTHRSGASSISDDGSVIVGFSRPFGPANQGRGFIWTEATGMLDLNAVAAAQGINTGGVVMALPLSISGDGMTIGGISSTNNGFVLRLVSPVPEPATMLTLALGLLALMGVARLRRDRR